MERRQLLKAVGAAGAGAPLLVACGDDSPAPGGEGAGDPDAEANDSRQKAGAVDQAKAGARRLGAAGDVPVGGGVIFKEQRVVVTQPAKGDFKAFSSQCTHGGCLIAEIAGGTINCTCHNSKFKLDDGSVLSGPARRPLSATEVAVEGDDLMLKE